MSEYMCFCFVLFLLFCCLLFFFCKIAKGFLVWLPWLQTLERNNFSYIIFVIKLPNCSNLGSIYIVHIHCTLVFVKKKEDIFVLTCPFLQNRRWLLDLVVMVTKVRNRSWLLDLVVMVTHVRNVSSYFMFV